MQEVYLTFGVTAAYGIKVDETKTVDEQAKEIWERIQNDDVQFYEVIGELKSYLYRGDFDDIAEIMRTLRRD